MQKLSTSVLALSLGLASTVHAARTTTHFVQSGAIVSGDAWISDPAMTTGPDPLPCIQAGIIVYDAENMTKDGSGTTGQHILLLNYAGFNRCDETNWGSEYNPIVVTTPISGQTFTYHLDAEVRFVRTDDAHYNDPPYFKHVTADVTITATGDLEKSRKTVITDVGATRTVVRTKASTREATVVVTNARLDGQPLVFSQGTGEIGTTKKADITITHE